MVGAKGFEPSTSWSRTRRASQAALRPDEALRLFSPSMPYSLTQPTVAAERRFALKKAYAEQETAGKLLISRRPICKVRCRLRTRSATRTALRAGWWKAAYIAQRSSRKNPSWH
jgi:hypothetical protein